MYYIYCAKLQINIESQYKNNIKMIQFYIHIYNVQKIRECLSKKNISECVHASLINEYNS